MQPLLISVIIPTYNTGIYIVEAVESVLAQSYPHVEIIVIDDGSTDDTQLRLEPYQKNLYYLHQENQGVSAARNRGIKQAHGELLLFLDADDVISPMKLEKQAALFHAKKDLAIAHSGWHIIHEDGTILETVSPWEAVPRLTLESWLFWKPIFPGAMLFSKSWVERVGGFDTALTHAEDVDLVLRIAAAGGKALWLREPTVSYRQREGSATHNSQKQVTSIALVLDKFFALPELPPRIQRRERQVRYYTRLWYSWQLGRSGHIPEMCLSLEVALQYTKHSRIFLLLDWLAQSNYWIGEIPQVQAGIIKLLVPEGNVFFSDGSALSTEDMFHIITSWEGGEMPQPKISLSTERELIYNVLLAKYDLPTALPNVPRPLCLTAALTITGRALLHRNFVTVIRMLPLILWFSLTPSALGAWYEFLRAIYKDWQG